MLTHAVQVVELKARLTKHNETRLVRLRLRANPACLDDSLGNSSVERGYDAAVTQVSLERESKLTLRVSLAVMQVITLRGLVRVWHAMSSHCLLQQSLVHWGLHHMAGQLAHIALVIHGMGILCPCAKSILYHPHSLANCCRFYNILDMYVATLSKEVCLQCVPFCMLIS